MCCFVFLLTGQHQARLDEHMFSHVVPPTGQHQARLLIVDVIVFRFGYRPVNTRPVWRWGGHVVLLFLFFDLLQIRAVQLALVISDVCLVNISGSWYLRFRAALFRATDHPLMMFLLSRPKWSRSRANVRLNETTCGIRCSILKTCLPNKNHVG